MKSLFLTAVIAIYSVVAVAQDARQQLLAAERGYAKASEEIGIKRTALQFFAPDTVIFRPEAINGIEFWKSRSDSPAVAIRSIASYDMSSNGLIGFTSAAWRYFQKASLILILNSVIMRRSGADEKAALFGRWSRSQPNTNRSVELKMPTGGQRYFKTDSNKSSRSAADPSMHFLRMSMGSTRLGGAYKQYAADDIRFLRDGVPPIIGKKRVAEFTKDYLSVRFPTKVSLIESGDMAYSWNPCNYANSDEGFENGNCLHVWKLRNKKWRIVLGVYSRVVSELPPVLKPGPNRKSTKK